MALIGETPESGTRRRVLAAQVSDTRAAVHACSRKPVAHRGVAVDQLRTVEAQAAEHLADGPPAICNRVPVGRAVGTPTRGRGCWRVQAIATRRHAAAAFRHLPRVQPGRAVGTGLPHATLGSDAGALLFAEGKSGGSCFVVVSGAVDVSTSSGGVAAPPGNAWPRQHFWTGQPDRRPVAFSGCADATLGCAARDRTDAVRAAVRESVTPWRWSFSRR